MTIRTATRIDASVARKQVRINAYVARKKPRIKTHIGMTAPRVDDWQASRGVEERPETADHS